MSGLKGLAGDTVWYGLSSIVGRLISYALTPLYTYVFLPGEFGIFTEMYAYVGFFVVLYAYGMETAYFRFSTKKDGEEQQYFNIMLTALISTSFLISGVLFLFASEITAWLDYPGKEVIIYWLAAIVAIDTLVALPFARLRLEKKPRKFAFIRLSNVIILVILNLFFYVFCYQVMLGKWLPFFHDGVCSFYDMGFKIKYVFLSNLLANTLVIPMLWKEFKGYKIQFDWNKLKPVVIYAMPLLFMGLAGVTNEMLSRALLKEWLPDDFYPGQTSLAALGIFGACYKLSVFMLLGIQAFRYAAEPFYFSTAQNKNSGLEYSRVMTGFVIFNAFIFLAVSLNLELISRIFLVNPAYREGLYIVPWLLMGYLFYGVNYNLSVWYKVTDKTSFGAVITGIGAILTVVLNYWMIPILGYFGSSLITFITFLTMTIISYYFGQKYYPVPYDLKKIFEYLLITSALVVLFYNFDSHNFLINLVIRNIVIVAFVVYLYFRERRHICGRVVFGFKIP